MDAILVRGAGRSMASDSRLRGEKRLSDADARDITQRGAC